MGPRADDQTPGPSVDASWVLRALWRPCSAAAFGGAVGRLLVGLTLLHGSHHAPRAQVAVCRELFGLQR